MTGMDHALIFLCFCQWESLDGFCPQGMHCITANLGVDFPFRVKCAIISLAQYWTRLQLLLGGGGGLMLCE